MSRSTLAFTSLVLLISVLGLYIFNKQSPTTTAQVDQSNINASQIDPIAEKPASAIEFVEVATDEPPTFTPAPTAKPPTPTPIPPTATAAPPTEQPVEPTPDSAEEVETAEIVETAEEVAEATPLPNGIRLIAVRDAALFAQPIDVDHTGYYVPTGTTAWAVGRSYDDRWIHFIHPLGGEGWAAKSYFTTFSGDLTEIDYLPYSEFVGASGNVTPTPYEVAQTAGNGTETNSRSSTSSTTSSSSSSPAPNPAPLPTLPPAAFYPDQQTSAIAYWKVDNASRTVVGGGKYQVAIPVRVPTGSRYGFDVTYLSRTETRYRNQDGDDVYVVYLSGLTCGEQHFLNLQVSQDGARMQTRNDFSYQEGAIFLDWNCR